RTMTGNNSARGRGRRRLLLLVLLFAAPVLSAYALYFCAPEDWQPQGRTNRGHLISPVRPVEALALHDVNGGRLDTSLFQQKWTLLLIGPSACDEACANTLYNTRQVRTALGKDTHRVQRLYVATDRAHIEELQALLAREHPDLKLAVVEGAEIYGIDRWLTAEDRSPLKNASDIYLLDPHGNWFMYYTAQDPPRGLLKDLKKVLRLSKIG
ncbi:MAG: SCO family protein, partial [Nevskiales bacterium]